MAGKLMHALQYDSYGDGAAGLKHVQVPVPSPKRNEVLLQLEATSLNPIDWKIQKGMIRPFLPRKFPFIPATDVAGEVVEVGLGVNNLKAGDTVVAVLSHLTGGGLAEFVVASEKLTIKRPQEVGPFEAAALPVPGLTALYALTHHARLKLDGTGRQVNILVTAASGGVGHYAVQLAKLGNAHITATCGARKIDFVKSLGADEVLDYKTPQGATLKSPSGKKYDAVIHCAKDITFSTFEPNLSEDGKVIDITPGASAMWTYAIKKITMSKKQYVPLFDSRHRLGKAEDAWAKSIDGHATGKIIVEP